ncbi:MAG TPA: MFS transporter [Anaerolineae bacterium]
MLRSFRRLTPFVATILLIEFLDELVYGAREAAWPLVRSDLGLTYAQIGILLGLPGLIGSIVEPVLGILGDIWRRRVLVLGGGAIFAAALLLTALSRDFVLLLASFILFYPASGAFVSLSQATLMDHAPDRHEQNMARWTFAGSLGVTVGPLALGASALLGGGWRGLYLFFAGLTLVLLGLAWRHTAAASPAAPENLEIGDRPPPAQAGSDALADAGLPRSPEAHGTGAGRALLVGLAATLRDLRRGDVLRWLVLLQFSDLMLDVLLGYLALYFVDVAGATPTQAGLAVAVWTGVGLLGDFLLIPLLERVDGLRYLRASVLVELVLFPAFLLARPWVVRLVLAGLLGLGNSGWYAILQARLYSALPGRSGTAMALTSMGSAAGALLPLAIGLAAERLGLGAALWLLLLGPLALLAGLPRGTKANRL